MIVARLDRVVKRYGSLTVLDGVSFEVGEGEVTALLGRNGAGKSTAISILLGLRRPDDGEAHLVGGDPRRPEFRRPVGLAPQEVAFPATLRVREIVDLVRAHYRAPLPRAVIDERFQLGPLLHRQAGGLSTGERRKVAVALAFAGDPKLVVLDEPTAGLDRDARQLVWRAVQCHVRAGGSALLSTHHLEEADALADRIVLIDAGVVVAAGSISDIKARAGLTRIRFRGNPGTTVEGAVPDGAFMSLETRDPRRVLARLLRSGVSLADLEVRPMTLEEALSTIGGEG